MMESCLNYKPERVTAITVDDLKKDLSDDFSNISLLSQESLSDKEHLQVYLRVRPFTSAEQEAGESQECVEVEGPDTVVLKAPRVSLPGRLSEKPAQTGQRFRFSQVYRPETTQRQIFDGTAKGLVKDVLEGGNSLIFTYGVTNAGKTFTFVGPESDGGIVPRSLRVIFNSIEGRIYTQNNIKPHRCMDFTRLTKDQQDEESTSKKNLLRRLKETDAQKSLTYKTLLEGSTSSDIDMQAEEEGVGSVGDSNTRFSVWVSFCEIYNESIHDLLEVLPSGPPRRTALRLSQDVKGNTFVKDLKWIQVNSAEEAYRVLKIGRRNQSFSSTKLNTLSSRSHSIFSTRILRIEDIGVPRVLGISELSLCDLAGSERCAKTQNKGERLKEAGNINTSLLTLGKCITALRLNQTQPKYQAHIPFRESKLTHYLQGFFCGRGKACMIVNINQCASMYDETLNVLKFSALAQKVVVLSSRPSAPKPEKSGREVSFIINEADRRHLWAKRRSTLIAWETTLEDVPEDEAGDKEMDEDEDGEGEEDEEEEEDDSADETVAEGTVLEAEDDDADGDDEARRAEVRELKRKLAQQQSDNLALECRIREEVTSEFMELFSKMESDYNERLEKEKEILVKRAEHRLEILKDLVKKTASEFAETSTEEASKRRELMDSMLAAMRSDLAQIKQDAQQAQTCLVVAAGSSGSPRATLTAEAETAELRKQLDELAEELLLQQQLLGAKSSELERVQARAERTNERLQEVQQSYERQTVKVQELMRMCHEKDDRMAKLQEALDNSVEATTKDRSFIDAVREEIFHFKRSCRCGANDDPSGPNKDVPRGPAHAPEGPASDMLRGELERLKAEGDAKDERLEELAQKLYSTEQSAQELSAALADESQLHEAALASLERERQEMAALEADRNALAEECDRLRTANEALVDESQLHEAALASLERERQEMAALEADRSALAEERDRLRATNTEMRSKVVALEIKMTSLEVDRNNLAEECDRLRTANEVLADESQLHEATLASLERERQEMAALEADRSALAEERDRLQATNADLRSKVVAAETEAKNQAKEAAAHAVRLEEELIASKALAQEREEETLEKSKMAATLEREVERLKAEVEKVKAEAESVASQAESSGSTSGRQTFSVALQGLQQECQSLARTSLEKRERIKELERELADARSQVQQLEEVCGELEQLCERQEDEGQSLQAQLDAERRALADAKGQQAELQEEAQGLREQLARAEEVRLRSEGEARRMVAELETQLREADTQRSGLEVKLKEAQSQGKGGEEERSQQEGRGATATKLQEVLAQQTADMEAVTKELSERKEQVKENLEVIRSLIQDLKLRDRDISWLRERLRERESEIEQLLYKISRINDENSALQRRLSDITRIKNETLTDSRLKDQTILQMKCDQPSGAPLAESPQQSSKVLQDLPIKEQIIHHLRSRLTEQITPAEQEEILDAKLKEIESLTAELMSLKECCRQEGLSLSSGVGGGELSDVRPGERTLVKMECTQTTSVTTGDDPQRGQRSQAEQLEEELHKKEHEEEEEEEKGEAETDPRPEDKAQGSSELHSRFTEPAGDATSLTQEVSVLDSSEVPWSSSQARRFPNQSDLDVSFTPPTDRINKWVAWDSEERPKASPRQDQNRLRHTTRKRRKPEGQSENQDEDKPKKTTPLKRLSKMNHQESPTVLGKAASQIRQQGSPVVLKNKESEGRRLQAGGRSSQPPPSPAASQSKAKMVKKTTTSSKAPEPPSAQQTGRPRRTRRKLYNNQANNYGPLDIGSPGSVMAPDQHDKEDDHLIIKRKLRSRTAKT
ncbi:hypothetical protein ACEWY4_026322 [Coilia grayii]|uniref:Kinesin motor domain-containing protein n=1 Tax=Coilia grayii TaxID=363190 RepID=A0ABD1IUI2_9TELE